MPTPPSTATTASRALVVRRRAPLLVVVVAALAVVAGACTPAQFQQWWTSRGNPPMSEPQLSEAAAGATRFWEEVARRNRFAYTVDHIDAALAARMTPSSWRPGCPVPLSALRYMRVTYMGFDGGEHTGELVVAADAVAPLAAAFEAMWDERVPIRSMRLVDDFGGDDAASMAADNTSAFNCRTVAGSSRWSEHSYGTAIDINPVENPYVSGATVDPAAGAAYLDRADRRPGMLVAGAPPVSTLEELGWGWGGRWSSSKDYQHLSISGR